MRTEIALVNLRYQRVLETRESFINIEPDRIEFKLDFDSEIAIDPEDEALGYKEESSYYHVVVKRSQAVSVEMSNMHNPKRFLVSVLVAGGDDIKIYFKHGDKDKAETLRQELVSWMMGDPYPVL